MPNAAGSEARATLADVSDYRLERVMPQWVRCDAGFAFFVERVVAGHAAMGVAVEISES